MMVFYLRFSDSGTFQVSGVSKPLAMPEAEGPRNWGQLTVLISLPQAKDVRKRKRAGTGLGGRKSLSAQPNASGALR